MGSTREALLACTLKRVRVKLPEFHLDLYVQEMNAGQREEYYEILTNAIANKEQKQDITARILLPSLLDLDGNPVLKDSDLTRLVELSPQLVTKLTNSLLKVSGLLPEFYQAEKKRLKIRNTSSFSLWLGNLASHFRI
jgi:hypothetical protein